MRVSHRFAALPDKGKTESEINSGSVLILRAHICYTTAEMTIKEQINANLKQAMLGGDKVLTETLRGIKSAILNVEVAENKRDVGLLDDEVIAILQKESKKRQESAELFKQGGNMDKSNAELAEKQVIEKYLPAQMSDEDLKQLVNQVITELGASGPQAMGQTIGAVKKRSGGLADGGRIAQMVKESITQ